LHFDPAAATPAYDAKNVYPRMFLSSCSTPLGEITDELPSGPPAKQMLLLRRLLGDLLDAGPRGMPPVVLQRQFLGDFRGAASHPRRECRSISLRRKK
jgi:hypothetical protein